MVTSDPNHACVVITFLVPNMLTFLTTHTATFNWRFEHKKRMLEDKSELCCFDTGDSGLKRVVLSGGNAVLTLYLKHPIIPGVLLLL